MKNELLMECVELIIKILELPDHTRKAYEIIIDVELEKTADMTFDKSIMESRQKINL